MRDTDEITPAHVQRTFWQWFPTGVGLGAVVLAVLLLTITAICLFVLHVGGAFQKATIQRNYSNTVNSQAYQQSLVAEMGTHVSNITGPGGLATTRASLPAASPEQQVLQAQELNELSQLCAESVNFNPQDGAPGAAQLEAVVTANCLAGAPVASPPLAPPAQEGK